MNLPRLAIDNSVLTRFLVVLTFVGGVLCHFQLGQLESRLAAQRVM